jgi:cell shape-determining protein MreC
MMITRSRSRLSRFLPLVALIAAATLALVFRGALRAEAARILALIPQKAAESHAGYQAILYQQAVEENAKLEALLKLPHDMPVAAGRVVARPPKTLYDTLLVVVDPTAGIRDGDLVLFDGMLLGTVSDTSGGSATVLLYSAPGATTEATVGAPTAIVVAQGLGGGAFSFEVPSAVTLAPGDLVTSASGDGVLAIVHSVHANEGSATATVYASSPVSLADIDIVEFIHPR